MNRSGCVGEHQFAPETRPISDIRVGDTVLAFDPAADLGRGALVPRKVVRLDRNTTEEWVKLTWAEGGEAKELIATRGHHFLDRFGSFPAIEDIRGKTAFARKMVFTSPARRNPNRHD